MYRQCNMSHLEEVQSSAELHVTLMFLLLRKPWGRYEGRGVQFRHSTCKMDIASDRFMGDHLTARCP
jgi:hypothetical protein